MVNIKTLLDKATNSDLSEPDWETILDIVEEIKQKNVSVKNAMKEIRKKLLDRNSTIVYYTLQVLDSVMKNCTSDVHKEILSQEFMGVMKSLVTSSRDGQSDRAIDKALELIGEWKAAFGSRTGYKAVSEVFGELEKEGFFIPEPQVASAAFIKPPPEWVMGDRCHMCRQEFNRLKGWFPHHCRNCGQSVCTQCSTKRAPLPEFGIKQPTRVCDICYKSVGPTASSETNTATSSKGGGDGSGGSSDLPEEYLRSSLAKEPQVPSTGRSEEMKMQEEDDLQLAIAMSLNEQDNKKTTPSSKREPSPAPPPISTVPSAPPPSTPSLYSSIAQEAANTAVASVSAYTDQPQQPSTSTTTDTNLARYLDRSYWEQRREQQISGGGGASGGVAPTEPVATTASAAVPSSSGSPLADTVHSTVEQFVRQLQQVSAAGGSVAADPIILSLYQTLNALHPQLLKQIDDVQQQKVRQEQLLHKINEAKTARAALNTMRREHQEKIRQQEEEQALLARMQMEQKLALLRQQKQEQLAYQQSLQQKRLENMHTQRQEYEQQLASQRELERLQLIAQEQQVLQRQLRDTSPVSVKVPAQPVQVQYQTGGMAPPPGVDPSTLPLHTLSLHDPTIAHQAPPLPTKLDHNIAADPGPASLPPPYQPPSLQAPAPAFHTMPTIQQTATFPDSAPPGSHGDTASLWGNQNPGLPLPTHLHPSPTSTPPQQHSPMGIVQPLGSDGGVQQLPAGPAAPYATQYQPHAPVPHQLPMQSLPQQQVYQPTANFGGPLPTDHVPQQQGMSQLPGQQPMTMQTGHPPPTDHVPQQQPMNQLPGQQPMGMQPLTMQAGPPPPLGTQRQESGPPLITFD